jgi:hypothetical protein
VEDFSLLRVKYVSRTYAALRLGAEDDDIINAMVNVSKGAITLDCFRLVHDVRV